MACLLLAGMLWACGDGGTRSADTDPEKISAPDQYKEGDSLPSPALPPAISAWLSRYAALDTGIRIHRMLNSGVPLHIGSLGPASPAPSRPPGTPGPVLVYSPDSSRAIDFTSYGGFPDTTSQGQVTWQSGEADQEVVLLEQGRRLQLMFNGPQTILEAAGWLTNDACLLGLIQLDEARQRFYPELMLFNFRDSLFTNFRTAGDFPIDLLRAQAVIKAGQQSNPVNTRLP